MKKHIAHLLLLTAVTLCFALPARAWDDVGHKIAAYIAWQQMTPAVRERVIKILLAAPEDAQLSTFYVQSGGRSDETLKREFFMLAATWPDIVRERSFANRYKKYHHSNWHYSDTFWRMNDGKFELLKDADENGKAADEYGDMVKTLRSDASDAQKALAIAWIEHLVGDIHQPLHASGRVTELEPKGDQGGNLFLLTPKGTPRDQQENLHWFWDSIVVRQIPRKDACDADYVDVEARKIIKRYPFAKMQSKLDAGNFEDWKKESLDFAVKDVYSPDLKRFETPTPAYKKKAYQVAQERLALAGYRMGQLFNDIFGAKK
ncbi:MAG TPA: S1/P1 nuclease [Pyrinomonadaceae bacterium]|nr:S1/P1 nuclease [Pyrinomonadaceae bacterium]